MHTENELYNKIKSIYPDIGKIGIDVNVHFDNTEHVWVVDLKKGNHELKTYLEPDDVNLCMDRKQCIGLGIQIAQLRSNIDLV